MEHQPIVCPSCEKGVIVPLQDTSMKDSVPFIKAWACTHCDNNVMLHNGSLVRQRIATSSGKIA
jgi:competence CoiA-like predicted nuclease